ncbi:hypothetical protein RUM44_001795 [Polyplax serrata]|uniref:Gamma-tubulin complex component n=1 Tax=Polyplax serrata TaxID=468196 RepID=A0ABR1AL17_POLSC
MHANATWSTYRMSSCDDLPSATPGNPITSVITRLQLEATKYVESQHSSKSTEYVTQKSTHPNQHNPQLIDWSKKCPGLISDFFYQDDKLLPVVPSCSQESIVVNDLISCMQGISGRYITANPLKKNEARTFTVNDKLDACWKQLATNILPVAVYYSTLTRFVEDQSHFKYGKVNHALSACLLKIRNDYLGIVAKLEDQNRQGELNLHRFYCQIQPYLFSFETIKNICEMIYKRDAKGGKTLSLLHEFASNCTGKEEKLCQVLLEASAVPYMKQLQNWLYHGVIIDPYNEFLINDNQVIFDKEQLPEEYSDDYWGKCYTINKEKIPIFLEKSAPIILSTGKYLNVLRQCGVNTKSTTAEDIEYSYNENKYTEAIQKAYQFASSGLLNHLMQVNDLIGHLKSVKHYLLFDQGDFFMKFMDMSEMELNKNIGDIVPSRLQTLVELALRTSSASADPYKDNIKTELHQDDIMTLLLKIISHSKGVSKPHKTTKGWESLTFTYDVKWPISLVLSKSSLMIYQLIFRHLFFCKYVERLLCKVWIDNKAAKKLSQEVSNEYKSAWDLRQRMLLYVHNLEYYMMVEVIEPNWNLFTEKLQSVKNLDELLECHNTFQTTCLVKCMLTSPQHFKVLNSFLRKCVEFCLFISSCSEFKSSPVHPVEMASADVVDFEKSESFSQKIANFNKAFTQHFNYLFKTMTDTSISKDINNDKMMDMLYRLDFNSYYKRYVEEKKKSMNNGSSTSFTESGASPFDGMNPNQRSWINETIGKIFRRNIE